MKDNDAILFDLLKAKKATKPPVVTVSASYGRSLLAIATSIGLDEVDLFALAGRSVKKKNDRPANWLRNGKGNVDLAFQIRRVLLERGAKVPAIVLGGDDKITLWAEIGAAMAARDPAKFAAELTRIALWFDGVKALDTPPEEPVLDLTVGGSGPDRKPLRRDRSVDDRSPRYAGQHDPQGQAAVVSPRKSTPRARR